MVIRCDDEVSGSDQLRSQGGENGKGYRQCLPAVPVSAGQDGDLYRYKGDVITVYIGTRIVYCGDCVNDAVERICGLGGIEYELWTI